MSNTRERIAESVRETRERNTRKGTKRHRSNRRLWRAVRRARKHGAKYAVLIALEARRQGVEYELAFALIEQESGFRNVFGCDLGPRSGPPFCHQRVTRKRVEQMLDHLERGGASNGIGLTQLTYPPFIWSAERMGGVHRPRIQLRQGFQHLAQLIDEYGLVKGLGVYNGGPTTPNYAYANMVLGRRDKWRQRLWRR